MLTDTQVKNLPIEEEEYQTLDFKGLYLVVLPKTEKNPKGRKYWKAVIRYENKLKKKVLGDYLPKSKTHVSLEMARVKKSEFKLELSTGKQKAEEERHSKKISEYPAIYIRYKKLKPESEQIKRVIRDIENMTMFLGDREPHEYSKLEVSDYIHHRLFEVSTGTIQRNFNSINAVVNYVYDKLEIDYRHRFNKPDIPHKGEDKKERGDFTSEQIYLLRQVVEGSDNIREHLVGLLIDTGMRVSEAVGLASEDVILDCETPHIVLHKNSFRRLKTKNSVRYIPLVGSSLAVAKSLDYSRTWLFPSYLDRDKQEFKGTSASNAMNKRVRGIFGSKDVPTSHSFRHTLTTRLRSVRCPKDIREEICGWRSTVPDLYGQPSDIAIKAKYLEASLEW